jgi:hypothetical protein
MTGGITTVPDATVDVSGLTSDQMTLNRMESEDVVPAGGIAQASAVIAAIRERHHSQSQSNGCAICTLSGN